MAAMFWRSSPGDNRRASIFRRMHERWLTRALSSGRAYPRLPIRRVDQGGFDAVRREPAARARADRWWELALDRVDLGRLDHLDP
jgi:hypothetical protein